MLKLWQVSRSTSDVSATHCQGWPLLSLVCTHQCLSNYYNKVSLWIIEKVLLQKAWCKGKICPVPVFLWKLLQDSGTAESHKASLSPIQRSQGRVDAERSHSHSLGLCYSVKVVSSSSTRTLPKPQTLLKTQLPGEGSALRWSWFPGHLHTTQREDVSIARWISTGAKELDCQNGFLLSPWLMNKRPGWAFISAGSSWTNVNDVIRWWIFSHLHSLSSARYIKPGTRWVKNEELRSAREMPL